MYRLLLAVLISFFLSAEAWGQPAGGGTFFPGGGGSGAYQADDCADWPTTDCPTTIKHALDLLAALKLALADSASFTSGPDDPTIPPRAPGFEEPCPLPPVAPGLCLYGNETTGQVWWNHGLGWVAMTSGAGGELTDGDKGSITVSGGGLTWTIDDSAVGNAMISAGAITQVKIGTDAVNQSKIADGTVFSAEIADNSVAAVDLAPDSVAASEIATDAVGAAEIAAGAVGTSEVAADSLGAGDLAPDSVAASEIAAGAVGGAETGAGAINALTDFDAALCAGAHQIVEKDAAGTGWQCVPTPGTGGPGEPLTTLAALKTCIETASPLTRECVLAPGKYDGTLYAVIPTNASEQHVVVSGYGVTIDPTGAAAANDGELAVFHLNLANWDHDSTVTVRGFRIDGSSDATETLLAFTNKRVAAGAQAGRVYLADLELGEADAFGTEKGIAFTRDNLGEGENLSVTRVSVQAGGILFRWDKPAHWVSISQLQLKGAGTQTRASNLCMSIGENGGTGAPQIANAGTQIVGLRAKDCGGFTFQNPTVSITGAILEEIGTGGEAGDVFYFPATTDVLVEAVLRSTATDAHWSTGTFFHFLGQIGSVDVSLRDPECAVFNSTNTPTLFDGDAAWTDNNLDVRAKVLSAGGNTFWPCAIVPFGTDWLAALDSGTSKGTGYLDFLGEIYEYAKSARILRRRVDSQPFVWRASATNDAMGVTANADVIEGGDPVTTKGCLVATTVGAGAIACSTGAAGLPSGGTTVSGIPIDESRPLYLNEFGCVHNDVQAVANADVDDAIDVIVQKQTTWADPTTWANITATPGDVGRVRFVNDAVNQELGVLGYAPKHVSPSSSTYGPKVFPAGEVKALRVLNHVEIDTPPAILSGGTGFRPACWIKGWN